MRTSSLAALALVGLSATWGCPGPAGAVEASGTAIAVVQATEALGETGKRILQTQGPVFSGDQIVTGPSGEAQVRFMDDTKLVVGPNSKMVIDAFVFAGNATAREVSINAVRGAFRFITGSSPKNAYTITTPAATIGVRGTEFDFNVSGRNLELALFEGQARICDQRTGNCFEQTGGCSVTETRRGRAPTEVKAQRTAINQMFRYVNRQANLRREFRVDTSSCGISRAQIIPNGSPLNPVVVAPAITPVPPPPPPPAGPSNHSGLGDGTNPGQGGGRENSSNFGTDNNGGGGTATGGPGNSDNAPGHNKG